MLDYEKLERARATRYIPLQTRAQLSQLRQARDRVRRLLPCEGSCPKLWRRGALDSVHALTRAIDELEYALYQ